MIPSDEFREGFLDAWRLHRDYFYDRNMHGVNWTVMRDKYGELVGRVRDREELSDLIAEMVSELSALHTFVRGRRSSQGARPDSAGVAGRAAGARRTAGGYLVKHVYRSDPDRPDRQVAAGASPVSTIGEGDVLLAINGQRSAFGHDPASCCAIRPASRCCCGCVRKARRKRAT